MTDGCSGDEQAASVGEPRPASAGLAHRAPRRPEPPGLRGAEARPRRGWRLFWIVCSVGVAACQGPASPAPPPLVARSALEPTFAQHQGRLLEYLAIDTTNPPGNEARAFPFWSEALLSLGLEVELDPVDDGRGNLWARLRAPSPDPGARPLILLHHLDVVPSEREHWTSDPFAPIERDGRIYGRGAIDTKILGILQLAALSHLAQAKAQLRRDVIFLAVYDEESGGRGAQRVVERQLPEWQAEYLLDEGGYGVRQMMNGQDLLVIAVAQKRTGRMLLTAHGEAGHGSRPIPNGGPNLLVTALERLLASGPEARLVPTTIQSFAQMGRMAGQPRQFLLEHLDWPLTFSLIRGSLVGNKNLGPQVQDSMSLTMLEAGQKDNVIPAEARATFDVRLLPDTDAQRFLEGRQALLHDLPVTLEWSALPLPASPAAPTDDPLFVALSEAARAHEPQALVSPWLLVGANDSRFFMPAGVKAYGFLPVYLDKAQLDTIHGHDENVAIPEFEKGLVTYTDALARFLLRQP